MTPKTLKRKADAAGCEAWWDAQWRVWALRRKGALNVEGTGGCYFSAGTLRNLDAAKLAEWCAAAVAGPEG